jgi:hypothetical protein
MATLNDLIGEVRSSLAGFTLRQDRISYLTSALTTTSTSIPIGSSNNLAKGIIEIDDELIWIDNFTKENNTMNAAPGFGRGYQGTSPAPHAVNSQVILTPSYPRTNIKQAINDTINSVYPKLWAVYSYTFTFNASQVTYALPDDVQNVLYMSWQTTGSSREWLPLKKWRADLMANVATFNTQKTINIYENVQPGRTIQVWYAANPQTMTSGTDDFSAVTGLPESCRDVVVYGAAYRLLSFVDPGRINLTSAESDLADSKVPGAAGSTNSRYIYALYQQRLQDESLKLSDKFPIRVHFTR